MTFFSKSLPVNILSYRARDYFCRYFKKQTGSTFLEYLNLIRLSHIHKDLLTTDETLTDLMDRHGVTNYRVFSRLFREQYNCTPSFREPNPFFRLQ